MAAALCTLLAHSSVSSLSVPPKLCSRVNTHLQIYRELSFSPLAPDFVLRVPPTRRLLAISCFKNHSDEKPLKKSGLDWRILKRWDVPWNWQTISLSSLACGLRLSFTLFKDYMQSVGILSWQTKYSSDSFVLTGLIEAATIPFSGIKIEELSLDEKAEILFADQAIATAVVLGVLFSLTKSYFPLPDELYRYDLREPFNLEKGWLLWAGIGLGGALAAIALTGVAVSFFSGETTPRETDALVRLLPLIGSSTISTACLVGITGVLAPILEETVFRGFFMVSLTKWMPTPLAVLISASVFAVAHLTPGEFPQLFVLGTALGFSYAQTRNLLTPITIHAFWNSGVILFLTFLQLQGYDLKELLQSY
ncbi:CAAX amino terminal protease family protein [Dorcoceras hygrometricum]|uniref:CAAX amino terminal protease family protein n=1 Tax=Dorcoceras hygrometricum TaxID=472368 RepID=A0A2Z7B729_9LAMI|nr:CAAX amino terminal protease family protein [Dorcoceras hygrometricum]